MQKVVQRKKGTNGRGIRHAGLGNATIGRAPGTVQRVRLRQVKDGKIRFPVERVTRPNDAYDAVRPFYYQADREILSVLCLDAQNQPTCFNVASVGDLNATSARPADIVKAAILSNSYSIILVHNHPSGCPDPSKEDLEFTNAVSKACEALGLVLYDHLVVTDSGFTSLRERGVL